jgi:hypothetical protein
MSKNTRQPPSGIIPRFPIWEVVILFFLIFAGVQGIITPDSQAVLVVLGSWSNLWNILFIGTGLIGMVGLTMPAPNGLVVTLVSKAFLVTSAGGALVGLIAYHKSLFFIGSVSLYVFTFGALFRIGQVLRQLRELREEVEHWSQDESSK